MQRAVIDTNIWVSGLIWHGPPRVFVQRILSRQLHSIVSAEMVAEFQRVLNYPRISSVLHKRGLVAVDLAMQIRLVSELVVSSPLPTPVCRDPDDDAILATRSWMDDSSIASKSNISRFLKGRWSFSDTLPWP